MLIFMRFSCDSLFNISPNGLAPHQPGEDELPRPRKVEARPSTLRLCSGQAGSGCGNTPRVARAKRGGLENLHPKARLQPGTRASLKAGLRGNRGPERWTVILSPP